MPRVVVFAAALLLLAGCSSAEPEWAVFDSPNGLYSVDMPGVPTLEEQDVQGLTLRSWSIERGDDGYTVAEVDLPADSPFDLQSSVQGTVDSMLLSVERQAGEDGTATLTSSEQTSIGDLPAREWSAGLTAGDLSAQVRGVTFLVDETLIQMIAVDANGDDPAHSERFVTSVTPPGG